MKFLNSMISKFDAIALRLTPLRSDVELTKRANAFRGDTTNRRVYEAHDSVDTKATAILQHVSVMIAVSGILFSQAKLPYLKIIFILELVFYICLALSCLRLFMDQRISPKQDKNVVAKEEVLDLTAKFTFLLSIILIITVIAEVALSDFWTIGQ